MSADRRVIVTSPARRDLRRLDPPVRQRILVALERLAADPPRGDVTRLAGSDEYRLRVGDWRVRFRRDTEIIYVLRVLPRGRAYRD